MAVLYTNNAASLLSASITNAATSFSVTSGQGALFPALTGSDYFYVTLLDTAGNIEIVKVTGRSTDTFTVARAQDGTSARAWAVGDKVELRIVRAMLDDLKGERLPLTGGTLTGTDVVLTIRDDAASNDGSWRGRIVSKNVTSGVASFLGNYQGKAGVYAHSAALDAWADLYVNTSTGSGGGAVRMTTSVFMGGNQALHAGNYTDYALPLTGGTLTGNRPISFATDGGSIFIKGDTGGWGMGLYFKGSDDVVKGSFGALGGGAGFSYLWAGLAYNNTWMTWASTGSSSNVDHQMNGNYLRFDQSGTRSWNIRATGGNLDIASGDGLGSLRYNGNAILHAGNYNSYSPSLSGNYKNISAGGLYSRYSYQEGTYISDSTSAYTLSPDYGQTTVAMHTSHGMFGSWATTLTMSGYERYGAYQISGNYNASTPELAIRNYNQGISGWTSWVKLLSSANYTSYTDGRYVFRNNTVNGNIDSDWGESFTTFDPVPSGTPPFSSPNIRTINLGNDYNRRTQLAFNYESDRAFFRRRTEGGWGSWREFLHTGNYSSYALPLSGGTLSDSLTLGTGANSIRLIKDGSHLNLRDPWGNIHLKQGEGGGFFVDGSSHNLRASDGTAWVYIDTSSFSYKGNAVLHAGNYADYTTKLSGPSSPVKQFFWSLLTASGAQARTFEIARLAIDYNDWNSGTGPFEVELYEKYYSRGLKKKYVISYGYVQNAAIQLVEYTGSGDNNFQCRIGSPVQVSGDRYYVPVFVDVRYYSYVDVRVTTNRTITTSNPPNIGETYIEASPSAVNISDFTADSTVNLSRVSTVQVDGNQVLHAGNYSSYALPLSGGTMSGAINMGNNGVNYANQFHLNNGFSITQGASNYGQFNTWVHLPGTHGFYSSVNGAHFYPNDGSYGAWRVVGTRNGWGGLNFSANNGDVTLMVNPNSNETGFYNPSYGWQIYWTGGTLYVGKNNYGGNTTAVLDASNYTNYTLPIGGGWYGSGLPGSRWGGYNVNGGEISFGRDLPNNGQMGILVDGCYVAGENNGFWSLGSDNTWGSRRGMYWDGSYLNFTTNTPAARFQALYIDGGGTYLGVNYFLSNKGAGTYVGGQNNYSLQAFSNDAGAAGMSFHRGGYYAINMGLDPDNVLRIGGWSASANLWQLDAAGNNYVAGNFYAGNSNLVLHAGNYTNYLGDYTYGNYRVIADYSSSNTWYIRSNGRFVWARSHDWTQSFELNLGNGTAGSNDGWALFGQISSNAGAGTWHGTRFVQYTGSVTADGNVRAGRYYLGNDSYYVHMGDWGLRNTTPYGWIQFGPANSSWAHIYSSGLDFYFNANLYTNGWIQIHSSNVGNYALDVNGGTMYGNATFQRSTDSAIDFYHSATPSGTSNRVIAGSSFVARNNAGTYQTMAVRRVRAITSSTSSSYGIVVDEAYVSNALNAYTNLLQDQWSFYSSYSGSLVKQFAVTGTEIGPGAAGVDNTMSAGGSTRRYSVVYAVTGTINTSDVNEKEQIQDLDAAERRVAVAVKGLIKKFKWKDAVAKKGDAARIHIGVIAQEVEAAFVAEGLDPERYALFCKDVWWEKMVPNENYGREDAPNEPETILETFQSEVEGGTRKERKGIRYDQLLAFVISAI